ncbi:trans-aconitate methyltransferase 1 [Parahypoxylon ruwenzoriense]
MSFEKWKSFFDWIKSLGPDDYEDAYDAATADLVAERFSVNPKLKYLGFMGSGNHGGAILFSERDENNRPFRKIIIKYSLGSGEDKQLINESTYLKTLRGAEHIVQILPLKEASVTPIGSEIFTPTIAVEFIPHGAANRFRDRLGDTPIPNRMIWRIFLCKGSPHLDNIVIGDITIDDMDHGLVPIFKLIDFGRGSFSESAAEAHYQNTASIGFLMACLVCKLDDRRADHNETNNWTWRNSEGDNILTITSAPKVFLESPLIEKPLKDLVARCLSYADKHIPSRRELLQICEEAVANRGVDDLENIAEEHKSGESDEAIKALVQEYILNAPVARDPLEVEPRNMSYLIDQIGTSYLGVYAKQFRPPARNVPAEGPTDADISIDEGSFGSWSKSSSEGSQSSRKTKRAEIPKYSNSSRVSKSSSSSSSNSRASRRHSKTLFQGFERALQKMQESQKET